MGQPGLSESGVGMRAVVQPGIAARLTFIHIQLDLGTTLANLARTEYLSLFMEFCRGFHLHMIPSADQLHEANRTNGIHVEKIRAALLCPSTRSEAAKGSSLLESV